MPRTAAHPQSSPTKAVPTDAQRPCIVHGTQALRIPNETMRHYVLFLNPADSRGEAETRDLTVPEGDSSSVGFRPIDG
jgi:hypothetical protein